MNRQDEERLEAAVDRELKQLPEMKAPETLAVRVMSRIAAPERMRSPETLLARVRSRPLGSFAFLATAAVVLGLGAWQIFQAPSAASVMARVTESLSGLTVLWNTLTVLTGAAVVTFKHLGPLFIALSFLMVAFAYAVCVGLGTMMVRCAVIRR